MLCRLNIPYLRCLFQIWEFWGLEMFAFWVWECFHGLSIRASGIQNRDSLSIILPLRKFQISDFQTIDAQFT
jgi:hypothetical protein